MSSLTNKKTQWLIWLLANAGAKNRTKYANKYFNFETNFSCSPLFYTFRIKWLYFTCSSLEYTKFEIIIRMYKCPILLPILQYPIFLSLSVMVVRLAGISLGMTGSAVRPYLIKTYGPDGWTHSQRKQLGKPPKNVPKLGQCFIGLYSCWNKFTNFNDIFKKN